MKRPPMECAGCGQLVSALNGKPMMHYERGSNTLCSGEQKPCRACDEVPTSDRDVASVQATGLCYACNA